MKSRYHWFLGLMLSFLLPLGAWAQYAMEEMGFEAGPGLAVLSSSNGAAIGPGGNALVFYSHYACGKAYGFHFTAGANALFPATSKGADIVDLGFPSKANFRFGNLSFAALGKIRLHEYHRPKEWAVFLGPKLQVPLLAQVASTQESGPLSQKAQSVNHFWTGVELSMQFRRPIGKKKSLFVHPGIEYYFLPAFNSTAAGAVKPLYVFLNFGYAFWDLRG
jgi:hypothetical protein